MATYKELEPHELPNANFVIRDHWNGERRYFRKFNHTMAILSFLANHGCKEALMASYVGDVKLARIRPTADWNRIEIATGETPYETFMTRRELLDQANHVKKTQDAYYSELVKVSNRPQWAYTITGTSTYD